MDFSQQSRSQKELQGRNDVTYELNHHCDLCSLCALFIFLILILAKPYKAKVKSIYYISYFSQPTLSMAKTDG